MPMNLLWRLAAALIAGLLAALMSSVVGTWIVLRGMSFFGDAFVHGIVPGIAAAVAFDINPAIGAVIAAIVFAYHKVQQRPAATGQLIPAPEGPYKVKPQEPGGMQVKGEGDAAIATSASSSTTMMRLPAMAT